jgi:two-component system OmpR family response regulator
MSTNTILIVEDDRTLVDVLRYNLVKEGYKVLIAGDGEGALKLTRTEKPDLVLLDIMLPRMSGLEVLMLTARTDEIDKVVGLEMGADDYVTKPFSLRELMARVRAMLRRAEMTASKPSDRQSVKVGDLQVDVARRKVTLGNSVLALTQKEFDLLAFLAQNKGLVFSREQLLDKVWGYEFAGDTRTVDVHIRWLRQKIETDPAHPERLVTVRGVGYKLEE